MALQLDDLDFFLKTTSNLLDPAVPNLTTLRTLYYPPIADEIGDKTIRCGEHSDYGICTLLFQDSNGGLEVT